MDDRPWIQYPEENSSSANGAIQQKEAKQTNSEKRLVKGGSKVARVEENKGRGISREGGRLLKRKRTVESMASETTQDKKQQLLPQARKKKRRRIEA